MVLTELQKLLKQTIGLDATSVGDSIIEHAVQQRVAACEAVNLQSYLDQVRESETEMQELIEAVIVPETWFFRDAEAFAALGKEFLREWLPRHAAGTLRLLSAPCSTGEEPYSMAMALLDAGLSGPRFRIDAVDISARALAQAGRAVYGRNAFRGRNQSFRDRHFKPAPHGYHLTESVRRQVHFHQANLLAGDFRPGRQVYDIIFCRNLLIYFDTSTQDRAIQILGGLLTDSGWLFVGPAEAALVANHNFESAKLPLAFAFRKAGTVAPAVTRLDSARKKSGPAKARRPAVVPSKPDPGVSHVAPSPGKSPAAALPEREADLDVAQRLADEGRLTEAAAICEASLRVHGHTAKAFFLLGLVRDAAGDIETAGECYRKAIYLDPKHYEALMHLAYLKQQSGNPRGAQALRDRARRLLEKSGK